MGSSIARIAPNLALALAALRGREAEAAVLIELGTKDVQRRGSGQGLSFIQWAIAVLCNGLGRYGQALAAAQQASEDTRAQFVSNWAIAELIEAATRTGMPERAAGALDRLSEMTRASGTDWALGIEARSRALITEGENAEVFYREAIDRLGRAGLRVELARAQLLYGEWLHRRRRMHDARERLRSAYETFDSIGAYDWLDVTAGPRGGGRLGPGGGRLFTATVGRVRASYTFTARSFLRLIVQQVRTERHPELYLAPVSRRDEARTLSALFGYRLNWQTVLYVGYGDESAIAAGVGGGVGGGDPLRLAAASRTVFFKVSYAYQR